MKKETAITCPFFPDVFLEFDTDVDAFVCPGRGIDIALLNVSQEWVQE